MDTHYVGLSSILSFEMTFCMSCFGPSSRKRFSKESSDGQNVIVTTPVREFIKKSPKRETATKEKRQFNLEDKQQLEVVTLQDWILDSPKLKDDPQVLKQFSFKVYPSLVQENPNFRKSFTEEKLLKDFEVNREELEECSLSRSQSEKAKKRVSFRLPDESDTFIFYPDDDELEH